MLGLVVAVGPGQDDVHVLVGLPQPPPVAPPLLRLHDEVEADEVGEQLGQAGLLAGIDLAPSPRAGGLSFLGRR